MLKCRYLGYNQGSLIPLIIFPLASSSIDRTRAKLLHSTPNLIENSRTTYQTEPPVSPSHTHTHTYTNTLSSIPHTGFTVRGKSHNAHSVAADSAGRITRVINDSVKRDYGLKRQPAKNAGKV